MQRPLPPRRSGAGSLTEADQAALTGAKRVLRAAVRQRREARSPADRQAHDRQRTALLRDLLASMSPDRTVATYVSIDPEPGTLELIGWLAAQGSRVLLPVLSRERGPGTPTPNWAEYAGPDHLQSGYRGIPEPSGEALGAEALGQAAVIIVSALACTGHGDRLGVGGGWFDRALGYASAEAVTIALVNDDEVFPTLPVHDWDRRVDVIATPTRLINTGSHPR